MEEWERLICTEMLLYSYTFGRLFPVSVNLNNLLCTIWPPGLLSTYLTEFWEPVPSDLPLACDWRLVWPRANGLPRGNGHIYSLSTPDTWDLLPLKARRSTSSVSTDYLAVYPSTRYRNPCPSLNSMPQTLVVGTSSFKNYPSGNFPQNLHIQFQLLSVDALHFKVAS